MQVEKGYIFIGVKSKNFLIKVLKPFDFNEILKDFFEAGSKQKRPTENDFMEWFTEQGYGVLARDVPKVNLKGLIK